MPSSNRYPSPNPVRPGGSRPLTYPRRPLPPFRPTRPFSPPVAKPGKFPGMPRPYGPFGRRIPVPGVIPPVASRVLYPWLRVFARLNPWLFAALTLYELWQLYQQWEQPTDANDCGRSPTPGFPQYVRYTQYGFCWADVWGLDPTISQTNWSPTHRYLTQFQPRIYPTNWRCESLWWKEVSAPEPHPELPEEGLPLPEIIPVLPPLPMVPQIPWLPITVPPLAPTPPPIHRPPFVPQLPNPEIVGPPSGNYEPGRTRRYRVKPRPRPAPQLRPKPPGRGTKERKLSGTSQQRAFLGWLLSGYSEANDLLDALHDALPKPFQGRDHPASKWEALYNHWDKVDMLEAIENIVKNQVTDPKFGKEFKGLQDRLSESGFDFPSLRDSFGQFGMAGR